MGAEDHPLIGPSVPAPARGGPVRVLPLEPRVVSRELVEKLRAMGGDPDFIEAAERAAKTNP